MRSDKDDVTAPEEDSGVDPSPAKEQDDPSLADTDTPVVDGRQLEAAGEVLAGSGGDGGGHTPGDSDDADADDPEEGEEGLDGEGAQMSLLDHLGELRVRLTRAFIAIGVGMVACYSFAERMFDILMEPMVKVFQEKAAANPLLSPDFYQGFGKALADSLADKGFRDAEQMQVFLDALQRSLMQLAHEGHFQYTYPAEAFFSHIKISIVAGLFLVSPYVFAQIWGFIAPGLYAHERKWMIPIAMLSGLFFTGGALFGYFQVFPLAFDFFAGFSSTGIQFTPKLNEYLSFCLKLLFAFGFVFELPLFIFFLARMGLVSSAGLRKKRKYAILIGFVLAAVLTPPDPFTQCLMAGPLIVLYEVGIWVTYFFGKKEKRHLEKQAREEAAAQAELDEAASSKEG